MRRKVRIRKYEIDHFDEIGVWESTEIATFKKGREPEFEFERGNMLLVKNAALNLITRDKMQARMNWKQVFVRFAGRGALVTRAEFDAAIKVN
jgi:hypothetical protein